MVITIMRQNTLLTTLTAMTFLAGCSSTYEWTEEAYFPVESSFIFDGVEHPPSAMRQEGLTEVFVWLWPQRGWRLFGPVHRRGPYELDLSFKTESDEFDQVAMTRFDIVLPDSSEIVHPYRTLRVARLTNWTIGAKEKGFEIPVAASQRQKCNLSISLNHRSRPRAEIEFRYRHAPGRISG